MRPFAHALIALLLGSALGCGPYLTAITPPPPDRTAELDRHDETIELSAGVALAFRCTNMHGLPCEDATATTDKPQVAQVFSAHLHQLSDDWHYGYYRGPQPRTGFIIVGIAPGRTALRLRSEDGDLTYRVTVIGGAAAR